MCRKNDISRIITISLEEIKKEKQVCVEDRMCRKKDISRKIAKSLEEIKKKFRRVWKTEYA